MLFYIGFIIHKSKKDNKDVYKLMSYYFTRHAFLMIFIIPILTLIAFTYLNLSEKGEWYLSTLSFSIVGIGVFSGTLKYINSLYFVKNHIKQIFISADFKKTLNDQFEAFVFSDKFLSSLDEEDLKKKWKNITYFKYKNKFPILWDKMNLRKQLFNYFFENDSLQYYYKSFRVHYDIKIKENDIIEFTETTDFTIVSNKKEKIELNFWVTSIEEDDNEVKTEIDLDRTKIDNQTLDCLIKENKCNGHKIPDDSEYDEKTGNYIKEVIIPLEGKNEYQIEKVIKMTQKYNIDRAISFYTSKIIDDIFIQITHSTNLTVFFHPLNENKFNEDNIQIKGIAMKNKEIIMPGDTFILFIDKKK